MNPSIPESFKRSLPGGKSAKAAKRKTHPQAQHKPAQFERLEPRELLSATWSNFNPGAGGQVQEIVLDPTVESRAFVLSDVEGLYRTTDGGNSWTHVRKGLASTDTLNLAIDPGNSQRVFLGTNAGLHTSSDGGQSWTLHPSVDRDSNLDIDTNTDPGDPGFGGRQFSIGSIVVNPDTSGSTLQVIAGVGNKRHSFVGQATVFRSTDGGQTFTRIRFGPTAIDASILQMSYDNANNTLYAAVEDAGVYRSTNFGQSWTLVAKPTGVASNALGVVAAENGSALYVAYQRSGGERGTRLFAVRNPGNGSNIQASSWVELANQPAGTDNNASNNDFRYLQIDPRSTTDVHKLLTSQETDREGLQEITMDWTKTSNRDSWQRILYYSSSFSFNTTTFQFQRDIDVNNDGAPDFPEIGWEGGVLGNAPRPLSYAYTPTTWNNTGRGIWTTGDQTLYKVTTPAFTDNTYGWTNSWQNIYSDSTGGQNFQDRAIDANFFGPTLFPTVDIQTFKTRGWQSTVDFDGDIHGNIVVSSKGDHGVVMSWDGGKTWEDISNPRRGRSNASSIVQVGTETFVLAHFSDPFDFGASGVSGELWAAKVDPANPGPVNWVYIGGGDTSPTNDGGGDVYGDPNGGTTRGIGEGHYTQIVQDPADPKRIYIAVAAYNTTNGFVFDSFNSGIYVIPDISYAYFSRVAPSIPGSGFTTQLGDFYNKIPGSDQFYADQETTLAADPNNNFVWNNGTGTGNRLVLFAANDDKLRKFTKTNFTTAPDQNFTTATLDVIPGTDRSADTNFKIDIASFKNAAGTSWLAYTTLRNGESSVRLSLNGGTSFIQAFTVGQLTAVRPDPGVSFADAGTPFIASVSGLGNKLYAVVQSRGAENLGYGVFEITLNNSGGIVANGIKDITGNMPFPRSSSTEVINDPTNNTNYLYMSSWGAGSWALNLNTLNNAAVTPNVPASLTTSTKQNQLTLNWSHNGNNTTSYIAEISTNSGFTGIIANQTQTLDPTVRSATFTALNPGTTYYTRVRAVNLNVSSANASTSATTQSGTATAPAAPSALTATATSTTQINLTWADNSNNETGFQIQRATNNTFTTGLVTTTPAANATSASITGLTANTQYFFRVRAVNGTLNSAYSNTANATTQATSTVLSTPTNLAATASTNNSVTLTWSDTSTGETGFEIQQSTNSGFTTVTPLIVNTPNATTFTATGLAANTPYWFRVRAVDYGNVLQASAYSNEVSRTTTGGTSLATTFGNGGAAWAVAATGARRIQAENFNQGGQGVGYSDLDGINSGNSTFRSDSPGADVADGGSGRIIGWFEGGEYLDYTIDVAVAGTYNLRLNMARDGSNGQYRVLFGQPGSLVNATGTQSFSGTSWNTYQTVTLTVTLQAGPQIMRLEKIGGNGLNFDWLELQRI